MKAYTSKNAPDIKMNLLGGRVALLAPQVNPYFEGTQIKKTDETAAAEAGELEKLPLLVIGIDPSIDKLGFKVGDYVYTGDQFIREYRYYIDVLTDDKQIFVIGHFGGVVSKANNPEEIDARVLKVKEDTEKTKDGSRLGRKTTPVEEVLDEAKQAGALLGESNLKIVN